MSNKTAEEWDLVIRSQSSWFDIDLKALLRYRDLVFLFVRRDFVATYKQTVLGPLWMFLQPMLTVLLFSLVFGRVANIPTGGLPALLFYLPAYVLWSYFSECVTRTSGTFVTNRGIFGKVYFPRLVIPISVLISNLFKFLIQFLLFLIVYSYFFAKGISIQAKIEILYTPLLVLCVGVLGLSGGLIVTSLTARFRDISLLLSFIIQLLMYGSSIIFSYNALGPDIQSILEWNPLVWLMEGFRYAFLGVGVWSWGGILYAWSIALVLLVFSVLLFNKVEKKFMDTV